MDGEGRDQRQIEYTCESRENVNRVLHAILQCWCEAIIIGIFGRPPAKVPENIDSPTGCWWSDSRGCEEKQLLWESEDEE